MAITGHQQCKMSATKQSCNLPIAWARMDPRELNEDWKVWYTVWNRVWNFSIGEELIHNIKCFFRLMNCNTYLMIAMNDNISTKCLLICIISALQNAAIVRTSLSNLIQNEFNKGLFLYQAEHSLHVSVLISYSQTLHENQLYQRTVSESSQWRR